MISGELRLERAVKIVKILQKATADLVCEPANKAGY